MPHLLSFRVLKGKKVKRHFTTQFYLFCPSPRWITADYIYMKMSLLQWSSEYKKLCAEAQKVKGKKVKSWYLQCAHTLSPLLISK